MIIILFSTALYAKDNVELDPVNEAIELGVYSSLYAGDYLLSKHGLFFNEPLIGGETDKPYIEHDTVPARWLDYWMYGTYGIILILPNNEGIFNTTTYLNAKGLFETMAYTLFITQLTKNFFGRKRPSYDNYPVETKESDGRKSFISGHSSQSFALAVYGSLFLTGSTGTGNKTADYTYKSLSVTALMSAAVYTGWSRVHDHRHNVSDVIAGAITGTAAAFTGYIHQNGFFNIHSGTTPISMTPLMTDDWCGAAINMFF